MTPEDFNNIASGIQAITVGSAVILGGLWAVYRFVSLREITLAKRELEAKDIELRKKSVLCLSMDVQVTEESINKSKFIIIDVVIENKGSTSEIIGWDDDAVSIRQVEKDDAGKLAYGRSFDDILGVNGLRTFHLEPEEKEYFSFSAEVNPGLFYINFKCGEENEEKQEQYSKEGRTLQGLKWDIRKFVEVKT